jgi:hypothetical protein
MHNDHRWAIRMADRQRRVHPQAQAVDVCVFNISNEFSGWRLGGSSLESDSHNKAAECYVRPQEQHIIVMSIASLRLRWSGHLRSPDKRQRKQPFSFCLHLKRGSSEANGCAERCEEQAS